MERVEALHQAFQLEDTLNAAKTTGRNKLIQMTVFLQEHEIGVGEYLKLSAMKREEQWKK